MAISAKAKFDFTRPPPGSILAVTFFTATESWVKSKSLIENHFLDATPWSKALSLSLSLSLFLSLSLSLSLALSLSVSPFFFFFFFFLFSYFLFSFIFLSPHHIIFMVIFSLLLFFLKKLFFSSFSSLWFPVSTIQLLYLSLLVTVIMHIVGAKQL